MFFKKENEEKLDFEEEEIREHLLAQSEISLIIKDYNDIFSSFDPRPFGERSLSDDFLQETKRATRDKEGVFEIRFLVPKDKRNFDHEFMIKKRLKDHFKKHYRMLAEEIRKISKKGIYMALGGTLMIFLSVSLAVLGDSLFVKFFEILLEPAGWFTAWTGLDQFFYTKNSRKPDVEFYKKLSLANIKFSGY